MHQGHPTGKGVSTRHRAPYGGTMTTRATTVLLRLTAIASALIALLVLAGSAVAAPVTIDFESGAAVGDLVTSQYGPPSVPAGPTFMAPSGDGFTGSASFGCGPGHISNAAAHSGSNSLELDGCSGAEFWPTAGFFTLGYTTDSVSFYVAVNGALFSNATVVTTAFDASDNTLEQVTTTLGPQSGPTFVPVTLSDPGGRIAAVAVEYGSPGTNSASPTGVTESVGNSFLYIDDLTYDPPASPPNSSFRLGATPPAAATTQGGQTTVTIPINWTNNPNPSASPVALSAVTPTGVTASFAPNPSNTGSSLMTLNVAPSAPTGQWSVQVTGTVGTKTSTESIPFG